MAAPIGFGAGQIIQRPGRRRRPGGYHEGVDIDFVGVADWGSHGEIVHAKLGVDGSHRLFRVPADGGRPSEIAALDGQRETALADAPVG